MERSKERSVWQRKREVIQGQQKELEAEMAAFVSKNEAEINELLAEYWTMRRQAGKWRPLRSRTLTTSHRGLHEHDDGQAWTGSALLRQGQGACMASMAITLS
jgi:hypothetical protein